MGLSATFDDLDAIKAELQFALDECQKAEEELGFLEEEEKRPKKGTDRPFTLILDADAFNNIFNPYSDEVDEETGRRKLRGG